MQTMLSCLTLPAVSHPRSLSARHLLRGACAIPKCLDEFAMLLVGLSLRGLSPVDEGGHPWVLPSRRTTGMS